MPASLFDPLQLGELRLANRIVMAPMTRSRAAEGDVPSALHQAYYGQRAAAGLIISEGTYPSLDGKGYCRTPGIATPAQLQAWRGVTEAVHRPRRLHGAAADARGPRRQPAQQGAGGGDGGALGTARPRHHVH